MTAMLSTLCIAFSIVVLAAAAVIVVGSPANSLHSNTFVVVDIMAVEELQQK